jgi:tetratricopeptide (TPR) repeat protein
MRNWLIATALAFTPMAASAQGTSEPVLDKPHHDLGRGVALVVNGRYTEAEKVLRHALAENPDMREGHYNLAVVLRQTGRNDEAIAEYRKALNAYDPADEPNRAKALYGIALAREAMNDKHAWDEYLAFARPLRGQRNGVEVAEQRTELLQGVKVPGTRKAKR